MTRIRFGLLYELFRTEQVSGRFVEKALESTGIRGDDYAVYSVLLHGPVTLTELAEQTGMPLTTAAGYAKRLTERGHVVKSPNPDDGRSHLLSLAPEFRERMSEIMRRFTEAVGAFDDIVERAGYDVAALIDELARVQGMLEEAIRVLDERD